MPLAPPTHAVHRILATILLPSYQTDRAMEETVSVHLEELRSFVSDEIFQFLAPEPSMLTSNNERSAPAPAMNNDHYPELDPHLLEADIDKLLLECSEQYEDECPSSSDVLQQEHNRGTLPVPPKRPFAPPKTESEISKAKDMAVPQKTVADTNYCVGLKLCGLLSPSKPLLHKSSSSASVNGSAFLLLEPRPALCNLFISESRQRLNSANSASLTMSSVGLFSHLTKHCRPLCDELCQEETQTHLSYISQKQSFSCDEQDLLEILSQEKLSSLHA